MVFKPSDAGARSFVLLAPNRRAVPARFHSVDVSPNRYQRLLGDMQRLRGRIYLEDGAIEPEQLTDSRHELDIDTESWHLLLVDAHQRVHGCARYCEYPNTTSFHRLTVARSALAQCRDHGSRLRRSVETEMELAGRLNLPFVELGGWALDHSIRATAEAFRLVMAAYALSRSLGGGICIGTATKRHSSASILRRLGGRSLAYDGAELPPYFDPEYRCGMEVLRFYSWAPNPRYSAWVDQLHTQLRVAPVFCGGLHPGPWLPRDYPRPFGSMGLAAN